MVQQGGGEQLIEASRDGIVDDAAVVGQVPVTVEQLDVTIEAKRARPARRSGGGTHGHRPGDHVSACRRFHDPTGPVDR